MAELVRQWGMWLDASGWSDVVGLIGSLVGIAGVPLAIWKAWQASRSAEAARVATEATALRINTIDAVQRLTSMLANLDEFQEGLVLDERPKLIRLGKATRRELIDLSELANLFAADDQAVMQATIGTLRDIEDWLTGDTVPEPDDGGAGLRRQLAGRLDEIHRISSRLKQRGWR